MVFDWRRDLVGLAVASLIIVSHAAPCLAADSLSAEQKLRADRLISVFENDTSEIQYGYVEALGDGRGYTAGRGLTTGTGDVLQAVRLYTATVTDSPLRAFVPRLEQLAATQSDDTRGLNGFAAAWAEAAADPRFRAAQDAVNDANSYVPAMALADRVGLRTPLARVALYDAVFTHGLGDDGDPDGTMALVEDTRKRLGGQPVDGVEERVWLDTFLQVRRADMEHAHNPSTRAVWAAAVSRVDTLAGLAGARNYDFIGPLTIAGEHVATIP